MSRAWIIIALLLPLLVASFFHRTVTVQGLTWTAPAKITPLLSIDSKPYAFEDDQGILWVVYESLRASNFDIYGKKWTGAAWLAEERLTNHASADQNPALAQFQNGTMLLVFASDRSGVYSLFSKRLNGGVWSAETSVTAGPGTDSTPALLQSGNGTLWLFWTRRTVSGPNVIYDIYYKTYTGGTWSSDRTLVNTTASEYHQSAVQADDGRIWVLYASDKLGNFDLYYKTLSGSWSPETPLTTNGDDDRQGWIMQDLNGTIWSIWARCVTSGSTCQDDIFYKVSYNQGTSWSSETQYTIDPGIEISDGEPSAFHARDKKIYMFWTSNLTGDGADFDIYYSTSNPIPIHDVGLLNATSPQNTVAGGTVRVSVAVSNPGDYPEVTTVNGYYENTTMTLFASQSVNLNPGRSSIVQLYGNNNGISPVPSPLSYYKIIITVQPAPGESLRRHGDNTLEAGNVRVLSSLIPGDVDRDGDVDINDATILAAAYSSIPGSPNWNQQADLDLDADVDVIDASIVAIWFEFDWNAVCPGDVNHDGSTNIVDMASVGTSFGSSVGQPGFIPAADLNRDGVISVIDMATVGANFGGSCI